MKPVIFAALILSVTPASAEPPRCTPLDVITIEDYGPGRAIVTYTNSYNNCSGEVLLDGVTDAGIKVRVTIHLGGNHNEYRETIIVKPLDLGMEAFPPSAEVLDGETVEIIVQGGLS